MPLSHNHCLYRIRSMMNTAENVEDEEEDGPEDTDEYVDQSPNGRWFRRDQPVNYYYFSNFLLY